MRFEFDLVERGVKVRNTIAQGETLQEARSNAVNTFKDLGFEGEFELYVVNASVAVYSHVGNRKVVTI